MIGCLVVVIIITTLCDVRKDYFSGADDVNVWLQRDVSTFIFCTFSAPIEFVSGNRGDALRSAPKARNIEATATRFALLSAEGAKYRSHGNALSRAKRVAPG